MMGVGENLVWFVWLLGLGVLLTSERKSFTSEYRVTMR